MRKVLGILVFMIMACSSSSKVSDPQFVQRPNIKGLTQDYAAWRSHVIDFVSYELFFKFDEKSEYFPGLAKIHFRLKDNSHDLTLDYQGGKVSRLVVVDPGFRRTIGGAAGGKERCGQCQRGGQSPE